MSARPWPERNEEYPLWVEAGAGWVTTVPAAEIAGDVDIGR
jgi:hypothetical protein